MLTRTFKFTVANLTVTVVPGELLDLAADNGGTVLDVDYSVHDGKSVRGYGLAVAQDATRADVKAQIVQSLTRAGVLR